MITAPTGSGKTLAAFLWALNQLIIGKWPAGQTSVLYVSPLRALNYDIQRNLLGPLGELEGVFRRAGESFPSIQVLTRSGDTPPSDRRRMVCHPPEILITTPESLNLLLSSPGGRSILQNLATVILDEIHAVFGTKRGTYLMTAVDRLVRLSGDFQRIALSATIRPPETVAAFVGGFRIEGDERNPRYTPRPVGIVRSKMPKRYDVSIHWPEGFAEEDPRSTVWDPIVRELKQIIGRNRSTLIFVNSRRLCEMLTLRINEEEKEPVAYAHHGSLSLEIRSEVERRLKAGGLKAIVATHSLELGIDIGALDEVVLIQSPFSISSAVQRVGRAGHRVGEISRSTFFPTHASDLLEAAVLAPGIMQQDIERLQPVLGALDVLAQVIVSMVGTETWDIDRLFGNLKASYPYRHLPRESFDLVLHMLAGRYGATRVRKLKPLVSIDRIDNTVTARKGALQILYSSGGVIPDRGYFRLRHQETGARIGELDEEFVWEAAIGDTFSLGTQNWQIWQITHNDVLVLPAQPQVAAAPFWKGEENGRDFHFSERIGRFLEEADRRLDDEDFAVSLEQENRMEASAAQELIAYLKRQKDATGCALPHSHHLVVEFVSGGPGGTSGNQAVIHTFWGGRVNRPLAMALSAAWEARFGHRPEIFIGNDGLILQLPHDLRGEELLAMVGSAGVEALLRGRLERSGFFGARFRECAGRALLLPRGKFRERLPLWLSRLRSQKLLDCILRYEDFPVLLETWRTCLQDEFDLESLKRVLTELESGAITWTEVRTGHPSPFARGDWWRQVNQYMYMDDTLESGRTSRLRGDLIRDLVLTEGLRPEVPREIAERFEAKRQRVNPGYSPSTPRELLDWVGERLIIPEDEWISLLGAMARDHGIETEAFLQEIEGKLVRFQPPGGDRPLVTDRGTFSRVAGVFYVHENNLAASFLNGGKFFWRDEKRRADKGEGGEAKPLLGQWLQFYGPRPMEFIAKTLGIEGELLQLTLDDLIDGQEVLQGRLVTGGDPNDICDSENFEILLRLARAAAVPVFEPLEIERLSLFLAQYQGMTKPGGNIDRFYECLEQMLCYPAEAGLWESEIFPARLSPYDPSWLDALMLEEGINWVGAEGRRVTFCFESDLDLLREEGGSRPIQSADEDEPAGDWDRNAPESLTSLFPDTVGRYDFSTLLQVSQASPADLAHRLWDGVWQGQVTNDTFLALRRGIQNRFKVPDAPTPRRRMSRRSMGTRTRFSRWKETRFYAGNWHLLPALEMSDDLLEIEERKKDRVRLLLDRYGILFRELLLRELPALRWGSVFRSLRIMELSGELLAGYFFKGIPGPQFISRRAFQLLQQEVNEDLVYWIHAADPASLCGVPLESLKEKLPPRLAGTHLVYRGMKIVMVSRRNGKDLNFHVPPDDSRLPEYFIVLRHLLARPFQALKRIAVETINGEKAPESPYVPALKGSFEVIVDYKNVNLF